MLLRTITITLFLFSMNLKAMENLPAEIICTIAQSIIGARNWREQTQAFALQSLACVNRHFNASLCSLTKKDFPYLSFQA